MTDKKAISTTDAQLLIEEAQNGVVVTDRNANITYCNKRFAIWAGRPQEELLGLRLAKLLDVPGRVYFETHILPMLLLQGYAREILCRLKGETGDPVPILLNAATHPADTGDDSRFVFTIFDATERSMYEGNLREARKNAEELAAIVRSAQVAIFRIDAAGHVKHWNASAAQMFGFDVQSAKCAPITELIALTTADDWLTPNLQQLAASDKPHYFDAETRQGLHLTVSLARIFDSGTGSRDTEYSLLMRDITPRVQAERQLQIALQELNHRVKNNLAVVSGIARQTFRSPESKDETARFMARLQSLSQAHDLLVTNRWQSADLRDLAQLTAQNSGIEARFHIDGPKVELPPQSVAMLALALFELMTNAIKYGSLSQDGGVVHLTWRIEKSPEGPQFHLSWREEGGPPVVQPAQKAGFGSQLINRLVTAELGGTAELTFGETGALYKLTAPYWDA